MISDKDVYEVDVPEEEFDALKEAKISFIEHEIEKLDWYSKEMVKLYFYEGLSFRKISELTNIPKTSCWNTIQDIKNKLIDKLEDGSSKI
jgi:DNA-directed RNA polymerase specialized sigma24 family protein